MLRERKTVIKGRAVLYVALLALTIALMVMLSRCDQPVVLDQDQPSGGDTLDIAIEYSPVTYYSYDDTLVGFDYDLLRLVSQRSGRPMKFHPIVTLAKGLEGLNDSTYDVLVAQFPMTAAARQRYGCTLHIVKGSPMKERIEGLSREMGDTIHVMADPTHGAEQLMMRVAAGEIKFAVVNQSIARAMAKKLPKLDVSVDISLSQFQAWVLRKDNQQLCDSINNWLERIKADKAVYEPLSTRYFE